jgi:tRNA A-37 threonylcarbamoyl transferase component Bud32
VTRLEQVQQALGGQIRVSRLIGTGGFAEVYAATDERLGRALAVKVLREELASTRARERFVREARAAAQVRHPNVLSVFDVGDKDGIVWFTMPLVAGESLRERLDREKRLDPEEATRILRAAAAALHAAHRAGLVHRDVKPDNILLDGPERDVLLADFGVAAALAPEGERITTEGTIVGTPRYMSPEQAAGEPGIDGRSDVYSLGVVAYEALSGAPPFTAANASAMLAKHLTAIVPPLRARAPSCPSFLADAVERCLAKDPSDRWPTAEAFRQALEGRLSRSPSLVAETVPESVMGARAWVTGAVVLFAIVGVVVDALRREMLMTPIVVLAIVVAGLVAYGGRVARLAQRPVVVGAAAAAKQLRRARAYRTAARALLAVMPKAERARLGEVDRTLDELVFKAESAALRSGPGDEVDRAIAALSELHGAIERAWEDDPAAGTARVRELLARHSPTETPRAGSTLPAT